MVVFLDLLLLLDEIVLQVNLEMFLLLLLLLLLLLEIKYVLLLFLLQLSVDLLIMSDVGVEVVVLQALVDQLLGALHFLDLFRVGLGSVLRL